MLMYKDRPVGLTLGGAAANLVRVPTGTIVIWSGSEGSVPAGWALCDGQDGRPDLRGRFVLGAGGGHPVGEAGGEEEVTLTAEQMPEHTHYFNLNAGTAAATSSVIGLARAKVEDVHSNESAEAGSSQPHENMPPYYALCYIIKVAADETDGGGSPEEVYSTEETRIGTWIDGKALYRRTISGMTPNKVNSPYIFADVGVQINLKRLFGTFDVKGTDSVNQLPYMSGGGYLTVFQRAKQYIYMNCSVESWLNSPCEITIEYTKTTDTTPAAAKTDAEPTEAFAYDTMEGYPDMAASAAIREEV